MIASKITDNFLKTLDRLEYGRLELVTPDGRQRFFEGSKPGPSSTLKLNNWDVLTNLITRGDSGFAEDYKSGSWDTNNLQDLLSFALANDNVIRPYLFGSRFSQVMARLSYLMRLNTIRGSKSNIHAHYDLGNDFYALWLDKTMSYSSALFNAETNTLEQAQNNKYDRILGQLGRDSGRVLEIGCGWGGFAERAMDKGDYDLKGVTISKAQYDYSVERLGPKANIVLEDYRLQKGKFDHIVSIEMFEAVGERYWPVYFQKLKGLLDRKGRAVIQTITIRDDLFEQYRKGGDVIRDYIFPGGMLPGPERFAAEAGKFDFKTENRMDFGLDYATTLEMWLKTFDEKKDSVKAMGFDEPFIRLWRFYLAACIAGFRTGRTNVMQVDLVHA